MAKTKHRNAAGHTKRHGKHQKHTKNFVKVYWPYLPMVAALAVSLLLTGMPTPRNNSDVLAYATNITNSGLLNYTNQQRLQNSVASLAINQKLTTAAQAKANDMVAKDYWSHTSPNGDEPWVFIDNANYSYGKAGENLAYGFLTSEGTVNGWMNSQSHKDNLLDSEFSEVGFGFANSNNYITEGEETIVVAMYATPELSPVLATPGGPTAVPESDVAIGEQTFSQPAQNSDALRVDNNGPALPVNTLNGSSKSTVASITRIDALLGVSSPWAVFAIGLFSGVAMSMLLFKHGYRAIKHLISDTERFVLHHPLLDATVISFVILGYTLTRVVGVIL